MKYGKNLDDKILKIRGSEASEPTARLYYVCSRGIRDPFHVNSWNKFYNKNDLCEGPPTEIREHNPFLPVVLKTEAKEEGDRDKNATEKEEILQIQNIPYS